MKLPALGITFYVMHSAWRSKIGVGGSGRQFID